jgi:hypothetical protein
VPPKQAPDVSSIITDDSGFGVPSTFGGVIPTPTLDRIANSGLRYNHIHPTARCSPSRAALITGRNHHSVGFGVVAEQATGFPGDNSITPKDKAADLKSQAVRKIQRHVEDRIDKAESNLAKALERKRSVTVFRNRLPLTQKGGRPILSDFVASTNSPKIGI